MKPLAILLLLAVTPAFATPAFAAPASPLHWTAKPISAKPGTRVTLTVTGQIDPGWHLYALEEPEGDCAANSDEFPNIKGPGMKPPKVISAVDPQMPAEMRQTRHTQESVEVGVRLDKAGAIADEWVVRGASSGADEQAAIAVLQYKFAPATCHGVVASAILFVSVNFDMM